MEFFIISMLNGLSYGLLLFMLSSGLTLIFSMMGVLNFAHASFYMIGAYFGYTLSGWIGFGLRERLQIFSKRRRPLIPDLFPFTRVPLCASSS